MNPDNLVAHHDPAHCLAPGLFISLPRGERNRRPLHVVYQYNSHERIEFHGAYQLGPDDLRVLIALIAIATSREHQRWEVTPQPETAVGAIIRDRLKLEDNARTLPVVAVRTTFYDLAKIVGYREYSGKVRSLLRESLERLMTVNVLIKRKTQRFRTLIISEYTSDEADDSVFVGLNIRVSEAIAHKRPYTVLAIHDMHQLSSDAAVMLFQHLSGWIDPGAHAQVRLLTLINYVFDTNRQPHITAQAAWKRRRTVLSALTEMMDIGWLVTEIMSGPKSNPLYDIARPEMGQPQNHHSSTVLSVDG